MKNLKRRVAVVTALALVAALTYVLWPRSESVHVTAYFPRTVGIYPARTSASSASGSARSRRSRRRATGCGWS